MKYWYLKGEDILGPSDVETIVKDEMFSADLFVCPEPDSDNPDSWQSADQYMQDFGYILDPEHYSKPEPEPEQKTKPVLGQLREEKHYQESETKTELKTKKEPENENEVLSEKQDISVSRNQSQKELPKQENQNIILQNTVQEDIPNVSHKKDDIQTPSNADIVLAAKEEISKEDSFRQFSKDLPANQEQTPDRAQHENISPVIAQSIDYNEPIRDISEETIHSLSPLNAPMDNNLLDEIPAKAVLSDDSTKEELCTGNKQPNKEQLSENIKAKPVVVTSAKPLNKQETKTNNLTEEEAFAKALEETKTDLKRLDNQKSVKQVSDVLQENTESLDTFTVSEPIIQIAPNQQEDKNALPSSVLAAQENKKETETKPGEALNMLQMPVIMPADTLKEYNRTPLVAPQQNADDNFDFSNPDNIFDAKDNDDHEEENQFSHGFIQEDLPKDNGILSVQEDLNNQFIAGPATTGKILNSDSLNPGERNKRNDLLYLMVMFMGVLIIVAVLMMFNSENHQQQPTPAKNQPVLSQRTQTQEPEIHSVIQGIDEGIASPQLLKSTPQEREALKTETYAENLVRKHQLKTGITLEEFFIKTYGKDFQARWASNKLYGDIYVVDFFASKVRSEPIRYMFRVNVHNDTIEGMNNSTIDLLSK